MSAANRRRWPRHNVSLAVREIEPEHHVMRATSISVGGLFCPDAIPRAPGTTMVLEIVLAGEETSSVVVSARVARAGASKHGFGVALEFSEEQRRLEAYLAKVPVSNDATDQWYLPPREHVLD